MNILKKFMSNRSLGPISDLQGLEAVLLDSWDCISGSNVGGMKSYKLTGRIEDAMWEPPYLIFKIERHGATVLGSSRAEMQRWKIDVETMSADMSGGGYRQLQPNSPRWTEAQIIIAADRVSNLVLSGGRDEAVTWQKNGGVKINTNCIVPDNGARETIASRRRKFYKLLDQRLGSDWSRTGAIYKRTAASQAVKE